MGRPSDANGPLAMTVPEHVPGRRSRTSGTDRKLQITDHLQASERPTTAYEIARSVGAPLSTIYTLIDELVERKLLERINGNVWLGSRLLRCGVAYMRDLDLLRVATAAARVLAQEQRETAQVCGPDEAI